MDIPFELQAPLSAREEEAGVHLVISMVSTIGVTVGVMATIIALAVMTGLQQTLRDRILGVSAHTSASPATSATTAGSGAHRHARVTGVARLLGRRSSAPRDERSSPSKA
jgi:ABC-type lipoprotein release transport system permease subunit